MPLHIVREKSFIYKLLSDVFGPKRAEVSNKKTGEEIA
jgi:hypothetical protein